MNNVPPPIIEVTLKYHADLLASRSVAMQEWDAKIGEIEAFMRKNGIAFQTGLEIAFVAADTAESLPVTTLVKNKAAAMILPGVFASTEDIARSLVADGLMIEHAKITRILSGTGLYKGHKTKGWSLRGEEQADGNPPASSFVTELPGSQL